MIRGPCELGVRSVALRSLRVCRRSSCHTGENGGRLLGAGPWSPPPRAQLEVLAMVELTLEKVLLALVPRAVMATMHTTMIRASMTAYSTAVGPSSRFRKFTTL